jgi:hypothetical protein
MMGTADSDRKSGYTLTPSGYTVALVLTHPMRQPEEVSGALILDGGKMNLLKLSILFVVAFAGMKATASAEDVRSHAFLVIRPFQRVQNLLRPVSLILIAPRRQTTLCAIKWAI